MTSHTNGTLFENMPVHSDPHALDERGSSNLSKSAEPQVPTDLHAEEIHEIIGTNFPLPAGAKILLAAYKAPTKTKGGIIMPDAVVDNQQITGSLALVIAIGPEAYTGPRFEGAQPYCKVGDWVMVPYRIGTGFYHNGHPIRLVWDDAIEAVLPGGPTTIGGV